MEQHEEALLKGRDPSPLEAALNYRNRGWSVVAVHGVRNGRCTCSKGARCSSPGKHPIGSWKEYQQRHASEEEVRSWFRKHPHANVGIVTGEISGLVVLDIDGKEGLENLAALNFEIPETFMVETGGGGQHHYFAYPPGGLSNSASKIAPKVDIRADGGFVVAPPSMHVSGRRYEWVKCGE